MIASTSPKSIAEIVAHRGNNRENLLQILHDIQTQNEDNSLHKNELGELSGIMGIAEATACSASVPGGGTLSAFARVLPVT